MLLHNVPLHKNLYVIVFSFLQIIVVEDTKEYISYAPKEETKAQDRVPFDLLVRSYAKKSRVLTLSV